MPIPVAVRSVAWVCGLSLFGIAGSNPTGKMDTSLLCVCCHVQVSATADRSSGGVLPSDGSLAECDLETSIMRRLRPTRTVEP
jgi:hypothetical protein